MKKVFISSLIMTLMLTNISLANISSVQAATTDNTVATTTDSTIKISLENIRDIMIENNLNLKTLDNKLKIAREKYNDAKDVYNGTTEPTAPKRVDYTDDATYKKAKDDYDSAEKIYQADKTGYETAKDDLKTAQNSYDSGVEDQVYSAQQQYLAYLSDLSTEKINEDTVKSNAKKEQVYKLQYESGFISKNDYINKLQKNTAVNDSNASNDTEELDRIKLLNTLGISPEEKVTFNTDITVDFQVISKINYEDDLKQMLDNNLDIKIKNDDIDDLDDRDDDSDSYDYQVDNAQMNLNLTINTKETDFKGKYNDLMASYNSIKSSYDSITQQQKEYQITQTKYNYGFISKNGQDGVDTAKLTLDEANAKFIKDRNECYLKYLKYIEMKEGY